MLYTWHSSVCRQSRQVRADVFVRMLTYAGVCLDHALHIAFFYCVCLRMLTYAYSYSCVCLHMLVYAWIMLYTLRMLTYAGVCLRMLYRAYAYVCWCMLGSCFTHCILLLRMLTYAYVCVFVFVRMLTYAGVCLDHALHMAFFCLSSKSASSFSCRFLAYVSIRQHASAYVVNDGKFFLMPASTPSVGRDLRFSYSALPNALTELKHVTASTN
jgi:hypothetical protein